MRLPPFLRRAVPPDEYARLAGEALANVLPMADLLRRRGIALGSVEQGRAHAVELAVVSEHLAPLSTIERGLARVRPPDSMARIHSSLRALLAAYGAGLVQYRAVCAAVRDADVEAYRAHNRRGRELDSRACESLQALVEAAGSAGDIQIPEPLRRIAARAEAYRRVAGGAFAFWE
jgi:hypothetical protein